MSQSAALELVPIVDPEKNPSFWLAGVALVAQPDVGQVHAFRAATGAWEDPLMVDLDEHSAFAVGTNVALVIPDDSPPHALSGLEGGWAAVPEYSGIVHRWRVCGNVALVFDTLSRAFDVNRGRWRTARHLLGSSPETIWLNAHTAIVGTALGRVSGFSAFHGRWKVDPVNVFADDIVRTGPNVAIVGEIARMRVRGYSAITNAWAVEEVDALTPEDELAAGTNVGVAVLRTAARLWGFSAHSGTWTSTAFTPSGDDQCLASGNLAAVIQPKALHVYSAAGTGSWTTYEMDRDAGDAVLLGRYP